MALFMSTLRVLYDKEETSLVRILLEGLICAGLTVASGSALSAMGYGEGWFLACGGMIGFVGSQFIRKIAKSMLTDRLPKGDNNE